MKAEPSTNTRRRGLGCEALALMLALFLPGLTFAQGALSMVQECKRTATTDAMRAGCEVLAECAQQCGDDDTCLNNCTAPGHSHARLPSSHVRSEPPSHGLPPAGDFVRSHPELTRPPGCTEALAYRDNQLQREFTVAMEKYDLYKTAKERDLERSKEVSSLMNQDWFHNQSVAEIAIKVKLVADEFNAFAGFLQPGTLVQQATLSTIEGVGITIDVIRSWVDDGARKASEEGSKAAMWRLAEKADKLSEESMALKLISPAVAVAHGVADYTDREQQLEEYKSEVQRQVASALESARKWQQKELEEQAKAQSLTLIAQRITAYCSAQSSVDISPRP